MRYADLPLPPGLDLLVVGMWKLVSDADAHGWIEHEATPDGCVEVIARTHGRSAWRREQPDMFVTGLSDRPIRFGFSGAASFVAIRLWPWAWEALGGARCPEFADNWIPLAGDHPLAPLLTGDIAAIPHRLAALFADVQVPPIPRAILRARSVADIGAATGFAPRTVQRWFARHIGLPARTYLKLLRFRDTLRGLTQGPSLAEQAAENGYADQAHMARDFRALAGTSPREARKRAQGPFI